MSSSIGAENDIQTAGFEGKPFFNKMRLTERLWYTV